MEKSVLDDMSFRWVMERIALPIIFLGLSAWMTSMNLQIRELQVNISSINSRVSTSEVNQVNMSSQLQRIETKLDKVIEREINGF